MAPANRFHHEAKRRRLPAGAWPLLALALVLALVLGACEQSPDAPAYDNPFDPAGPFGGDGLALSAAISGGDIRLSWQQPQNLGITEYAIEHSFQRDTGYEDPILIEQTPAAVNIYLYEDAEPTTTHWFRIQAFTADGDFNIVSYATPTGATPGPRVILGADTGKTATRYTTVRVVVTRGDSLSLRLGPDFGEETVYPAAAAGDTADIVVDFGEVPQDSTVSLQVTAFGTGYTSTPTRAEAKVDFSPDFALKGGGTRVGDRTPLLTVPVEGVTAMRFAPTEADLAVAPWLAPAALHESFELSADTTPQEIWGEFTGDFGFNSEPSQIIVTPDLLTGAGFHLAIPEDHVTETEVVTAILTGARATLMRHATTPDLAGAPWQAFDDTFAIDLGPAAGLTTIYVQMRNDWADSPVLSDYAIHLALGVEVDFLAPATGAAVLGGTPLQVRGRANTDSVMVDLGDGLGFRFPESVAWDEITEVADWSLSWDVPAVEAAAAHVLRARAWKTAGAELDSATATISVNIQP